MRVVVKGVVLTVIAVATASVTLAQLNLPHDFWPSQDRLLYAAVAVLSFAAVTQIIQYVHWATSAQQVREYERNMRAVLAVGIKQVAAQTSAPMSSVGIHVFVVVGGVRKCLVNVGSLRLDPAPCMDAPVRRKGKGVVGMAWKKNRDMLEDWQRYFDTNDQVGLQTFNAKPSGDRFGLTWDEFQLTKGYQRIWASPIRSNNGAIVGMITVDAPASRDELKRNELQDQLRQVVVSVRRLGKPPVAWSGRVVR